jgi:Fumarylacetoacetate (FAA) hydrolase family
LPRPGRRAGHASEYRGTLPRRGDPSCGNAGRTWVQWEAREEIRWLIGEVGNNPIAAITPARSFPAIGPQRISLKVGDTIKQDAHLSDLIWSVPELVSHLSRYYHLRPGDHLVGEIDGLERVVVTIGNPS